MKGVLIRGASLPRFCEECPCLGYYTDDNPYCGAMSEEFDEDYIAARQSWCPLVEINDTQLSHCPQMNIYSRLP